MIRDIYNMRHFRFSTWKLLAGLLLAGCTASDETLLPGTGNEGGEEENLVRICAIGGMPEGGPETRLVYTEDKAQDPVGLNITWKDPNNGEREKFVATQGEETQTPYLFTLYELDNSNKHNASFETAVLPDALTDGNTFYAFYPVPAATELSATSFPIDLTEQTGKLDDLPTYMYATTKYTETEQKLNFEFKHLTAVVRLTLKFDNDYLTEIKDVRFLAKNLHRKAMVDVTQEKVKYEAYDSSETEVINSGDGILYTQSNSDNKKEIVVYFCLLPGEYEDVSVVTFSSTYGERFYSDTQLQTKNLEAGKVYSATINMKKDKKYTLEIKGAPEQYAGAEITITSKDDPDAGSIRGRIGEDGSWTYKIEEETETNKDEVSKALQTLHKILREGNTVVINIEGATLTRASTSDKHVVTAEEAKSHILNLSELTEQNVTYPKRLFIIGGSTWVGWTMENASLLVQYDSEKPWLYTYTGWIKAGTGDTDGFKFLTELRWAGPTNNVVEYRCAKDIDATTGEGMLRANGDDVKFTLPSGYESGNYRITCDLRNMTVKIEKITIEGYENLQLKHSVLFLLGYAVSGDWSVKNAVPIYADKETPYLFEGEVYLTATGDKDFRICVNPYCDDTNNTLSPWSQFFYWKDSNGNMTETNTNTNWTITESGYYKFTIDMRDLSIKYEK